MELDDIISRLTVYKQLLEQRLKDGISDPDELAFTEGEIEGLDTSIQQLKAAIDRRLLMC